jgi:UDP-N-acetylglucosamine 2-epimerase
VRDETEWVETVETGWNNVVGASRSAILKAVRSYLESPPKEHPDLYGDGDAASRIVSTICKHLNLTSRAEVKAA